jgi:hypothetical protein
MIIIDSDGVEVSLSTGLLLICLILFLFWGGYRIVAKISFDHNCGRYLKNAANAKTVDVAKAQLKVALAYMEKNHLTEGYTSILYETSDDNVGYWYDNINSRLGELKNLPSEATPLEKFNMLMELRNTLLSDTSSSSSIIVPEGISVYPDNKPLAIFVLLSFFLTAILFFWF